MHNEINPVGVRRLLLPALVEAHLTVGATLAAFKSAGFVFDHGVRCQLPMNVVRRERAKARDLRPSIADAAVHLHDAVDAAPKVWVMGAIARAALASQLPHLPFSVKRLDPPYTIGSKFFVSQKKKARGPFRGLRAFRRPV